MEQKSKCKCKITGEKRGDNVRSQNGRWCLYSEKCPGNPNIIVAYFSEAVAASDRCREASRESSYLAEKMISLHIVTL